MRIRGAFLADRVEPLPDGGLNIVNAGWGWARLPAKDCALVLLCDIAGDDLGNTFTVLIDLLTPDGEVRKPALRVAFPVPAGTTFISIEHLELPTKIGVPGRYVYTIRLEDPPGGRGQVDLADNPELEHVVIPLDVTFTDHSGA